MLKEVMFTGFYFLLFNFLLYRFRCLQLPALRPWVTLAFFHLKFAAGLLIWVIYTFYYTDVQNNDVHKYYTDAVVLHSYGTEHPLAFAKVVLGDADALPPTIEAQLKNWSRHFDEAPFNENQTVIKLHALLLFFSDNTYFVHILFMCFISLLGFKLLLQAIFPSADSRVLLALPVLLLPSVLLWSSGVMKEPLLVFGLGVYVYALSHFRWNAKQVLLLFAGAWLILVVKFYVLVCLLPATAAFLWSRNANSIRTIAAKYVAVLLLLSLVVFALPRIFSVKSPLTMLANKQEHAVKEATYFKAGSAVDIPSVTDEWSLLKAVPAGLRNVGLRPYLWECKNPLMLLSGLETLLILVLLLAGLALFGRQHISTYSLFLFLLFSSLLYFALIGVTTPVLGNLVRYKAPMLPLFVFAFAYQAKLIQVPAFCHRWLLQKM